MLEYPRNNITLTNAKVGMLRMEIVFAVAQETLASDPHVSFRS